MTKYLLMFILALSGEYVQSQNDSLSLASFTRSQSKNYTINKTSDKHIHYRIEKCNNFESVEKIYLKAKKPHKNQNSYNRNWYQNITLTKINFADQRNCSISTDSLLSCFDGWFGCLKLERGKNGGGKVTPCIYILNSTSIIIAETGCADVDPKWDNLKIDLVRYFCDEDTDILLMGCNPIYWSNRKMMIEKR